MAGKTQIRAKYAIRNPALNLCPRCEVEGTIYAIRDTSDGRRATINMQNKPNSLNAKMNVSFILTKNYENISNWTLGENKLHGYMFGATCHIDTISDRFSLKGHLHCCVVNIMNTATTTNSVASKNQKIIYIFTLDFFSRPALQCRDLWLGCTGQKPEEVIPACFRLPGR